MPTPETTIKLEATTKENNGAPHTIEVKSGNNRPEITVTITRGETKIHVSLRQLFDLITESTKQIQLKETAKRMRAAQREFFKTRDADYLDLAKKLEKQLDSLIESLENPELF